MRSNLEPLPAAAPVAAPAPDVGRAVRLAVHLDIGTTTFRATVRSVRPHSEGVRVGLEFDPGQLDQQARLTLGLFAAGSAVAPLASQAS